MTSEEATQYFLDLINDGIYYDINDVKKFRKIEVVDNIL